MRATRVVVVLVVADDITLEVIDNGVGLTPSAEGSGLGLTNLQRRAEKLGGTFEIQVVDNGGAKATWRVPI